MSVYEQMVEALREKRRLEEQERARRDAEARADAATRARLIDAVLNEAKSNFFRAQQNDFDGLQLIESDRYHLLQWSIYAFTVNGQGGKLVIAHDPMIGGDLISLVPQTNPDGFSIEGKPGVLSVAEVNNLVIERLLGWVQKHSIPVR